MQVGSERYFPYNDPMFGFLLKKAFFDLWDNFLAVILVNLGFLLVLSIPLVAAPAAANISIFLGLAVVVLGVSAVALYLGGASSVASEIADFRAVGWSTFWVGLKGQALSSLVFAGITGAHLILLSVAVPIYSQMANFLGLVALAMLLWVSVLWWLASQYYYPIRTRLDSKITKILRKSGILFFDNSLFSFALFVAATFVFGISLFTALLIPGIGGVLILHHVATRLRLYKYDYLEEHPEANRKAIPWDELLYEDRERVGKRTLRGMIFPWKE